MKVSVTPWKDAQDPMRVAITLSTADALMLAMRLGAAAKSAQPGGNRTVTVIGADIRISVTVDPKER